MQHSAMAFVLLHCWVTYAEYVVFGHIMPHTCTHMHLFFSKGFSLCMHHAYTPGCLSAFNPDPETWVAWKCADRGENKNAGGGGGLYWLDPLIIRLLGGFSDLWGSVKFLPKKKCIASYLLEKLLFFSPGDFSGSVAGPCRVIQGFAGLYRALQGLYHVFGACGDPGRASCISARYFLSKCISGALWDGDKTQQNRSWGLWSHLSCLRVSSLFRLCWNVSFSFLRHESSLSREK